ncbi:conserved hypothetical protein [Talaromyces stipitatus ATCC 10500]|uniref:Uncharacterized protein n=1 Tax=Talaromyces stipitatus (strain ATCC 10500 / CBS 375.48 / QM 6759 / NRRL 1006) TaxID=441959 RepID=B8MMN4_TALSN|nr:uncharacterized protein TSTA_100330 [Talaromyces stipitatus ATCC 10500]EED13788.1 conserved hypothetical protein [Talaromyces stipitatus ATCC 10500]
MDQTFLFVDGFETGKAARQRIRSHVMNGKNAGKKVHRRSRLGLMPSTPYYRRYRTSEQCDSHNVDRESGMSQGLPCPLTNSRILGDPFRTLSYPVEPTSYSLDIFNEFFSHVINKFYPCHLGISPDDAKYWWLQLSLADEAAYHCMIAVTDACIHFFRGGGASTREALYHRSRTLTLVTERLAGDDALSDSTISLVVMMIVQEQIRRGVPEAHIHYEGLRKMIEIRGGISQLEQSPTLLLKICKMDNIYAWQYGRPISFFRDCMPEARARLESEGLPFDLSLAESVAPPHKLNSCLREILLDVINVSVLFNRIPPTTRLNYITFAELVHSICYRLIKFQPLHEPSSLSDLEDVYHMALTVFMMTLFMKFDDQRLLRCEAVFERLRTILRRNLAELDTDLVLWMLFIGGIWIRNGPDDSWLYTKIRKLTRSMGLDSWEEIYPVISVFPWIKSLHNGPGVALWDSVYELSRVGDRKLLP